MTSSRITPSQAIGTNPFTPEVAQQLAQKEQQIRGLEADMAGMQRALQAADELEAATSQVLSERDAVCRLIDELDTLVHFGTVRKSYARKVARDVALNLVARNEYKWAH